MDYTNIILEYGTYITAAIGIATIIVKVTPNETDNKILEYVIKFAEILGLNVVKEKSVNDKDTEQTLTSN